MKRVLSLVLALVMVLGMIPMGFAADQTAGEVLKGYGLVAGYPDGSLGENLKINRAEMMVQLARLNGKFEEAKTFNPALTTFTDLEGFAWAAPYIAYAEINDWTAGVGAGRFNPAGEVTLQEAAVFMLKSLGYVADVDFNWANAVEVATAKGLVAGVTATGTAAVTRGQLFTVMLNTLNTNLKDGSMTLGEKLGVLAKAQAVKSAAATGVKKLAVTFEKAVEGNAVFAVKRGSVTINVSSVEWSTDKKVATLNLVSNMIEGKYDITVTGLEIAEGKNVASVDVVAEKVTSIEIKNDVAPIADPTYDADTNPIINQEITFNYVVKNQYGEDMTSRAALTWTVSQGQLTDVSTGVKKITSVAPFTKDQLVVVSALHASTGTFATKTLKVGDPAKVASFTTFELYHKDGKTLVTNSTFGDFYIVIEALDQYGNKVTRDQLNSDVTLVNSSTSIIALSAAKFVAVPNTTKIGVQLEKPANNVAGTANVMVISNFTGQSKSVAIPVAAAAKLDQLTLQAPADLVVQGETVKIPFTAIDQFGVELSETAKADLTSDDVTITTTAGAKMTYAFDYNYVTKKAELKLSVAADAPKGSVVIMAVTKAGKVSQITVDVKEMAKAVAVTSTKDIVTNMTAGATSVIDVDNLVVIDQYGREMKLDSTFFTNYKITFASSDSAKVTVTPAEITSATGEVELKGIATGSSTVAIELVKLGSPNEVVANSKFEFTAATVAKSAITSYVVEAPELLYNAASHAKDFDVYGKLNNGNKVALVPDTDFTVSTNNAGVTYVDGKLQAVGVFSAQDVTDKVTEKTVTVVVVINADKGPETMTRTVKISNVAPKLTEIKLKDAGDVVVKDGILYAPDTATLAHIVAAFKGYDQYAVAYTYAASNVIVTNVDFEETVTITNNGRTDATITGTLTPGDSFKVTVVANGLTVEANVVIVD